MVFMEYQGEVYDTMVMLFYLFIIIIIITLNYKKIVYSMQ
jgi:hypothetical protein